MALLVYVDDIILACNNENCMNKVKQFLNQNFKIKNLGKLSYFLDLEVIITEKVIYMNQCKYALDILADRGMLVTKLCFAPLAKNVKSLFGQNGSVYEEQS